MLHSAQRILGQRGR